MSRSEELWGVIKQKIEGDNLIDEDQLERISRPILLGEVSVDDWSLVIENTLLKEDNNGE